MSRGKRTVASGNLSLSMRDNYSEHGVDEYYRKVGTTYRNPHYPGVRLCMFSWLSRWWQMEREYLTSSPGNEHKIMLFDLACGYGEVTIAFAEWLKTGQSIQDNLMTSLRKSKIPVTAIGPEFPRAYTVAADPYTSEAFKQRTGLSCDVLSFKDVAEGAVPSIISDLTHPPSVNGQIDDVHLQSEDARIELVVCSFALHLVESSSELFSLLWELSTKVRWLVVIAPHKKPEIKDGWGWVKWNADTWSECQTNEIKGEFLHDRVHCRVYKSLNV